MYLCGTDNWFVILETHKLALKVEVLLLLLAPSANDWPNLLPKLEFRNAFLD